MILDEATAALDAYSEEAVQTALDNASVNRTTICITHKAATSKRADHVIVFTLNGIGEQGSPEALMELGGLYAKFQATATSSQAQTKKSSVETLVDDFAPHDVLIKEGRVVDYEDSRSSRTEPRDLSLLQCVLIIFYGQRQYWPWMAADFVPCFFGGKNSHSLLSASKLRQYNRLAIRGRSLSFRRNGKQFCRACGIGVQRNQFLGPNVFRSCSGNRPNLWSHRFQRDSVDLCKSKELMIHLP